MSKKKPVSLTKIIVPMVILLNIAFVAVAIWVQFATAMELSSTLITCWFGFTTGELWMLSSIKKSKLKNQGNEHIHSDEDIVTYEDDLEE